MHDLKIRYDLYNVKSYLGVVGAIQGLMRKWAPVLSALKSKLVCAVLNGSTPYCRGGAKSNNRSQGSESPGFDLMGVQGYNAPAPQTVKLYCKMLCIKQNFQFSKQFSSLLAN